MSNRSFTTSPAPPAPPNSITTNSLCLPLLFTGIQGHIAKAERQLKENLKRVDVVLEVLDARIPLTSHHPQLQDLDW